MKTEERSRHTVWMEDTVWQRVQEHYKRDGCSTQNEFIAKAILFYCGYLQSEYAGDFLPKILGETLEAILSMFGDRIGKLLLKQAVEQNSLYFGGCFSFGALASACGAVPKFISSIFLSPYCILLSRLCVFCCSRVSAQQSSMICSTCSTRSFACKDGVW